MRRSLLILAALSALTVPALAAAAHSVPGDGTLAVRHASGDTLLQPVIGLALTGAVVGDVDRGRIIVVSALGPASTLPVVTQQDGTLIDPTLRDDGALVYQAPVGSGLRFRAVGGTYKLRISGQGIDINAVGQGKAWLDGSLSTPARDGMFSLDGGSWTSLPPVATAYTIGS
jgi:hypothetical protein